MADRKGWDAIGAGGFAGALTALAVLLLAAACGVGALVAAQRGSSVVPDATRKAFCQWVETAPYSELSDLGKAGDPRALDALLHEVASGGYDGEEATTLLEAIYGIGPSVLPRLRDYRGKNKGMVEIVVECLAEGHPPV